jgi:rRNA maturation endonuclease Nob1
MSGELVCVGCEDIVPESLQCSDKHYPDLKYCDMCGDELCLLNGQEGKLGWELRTPNEAN